MVLFVGKLEFKLYRIVLNWEKTPKNKIILTVSVIVTKIEHNLHIILTT